MSEQAKTGNDEREETTAFLAALGGRVRTARARRGMTRKNLARQSGVSERYLSQLENGQGNISIVLLRQVANALNIDLADLVGDGADISPELKLLFGHLSQLPQADLELAGQLIIDTFGRARVQAGRVALIGLRGAGKTTLSKELIKVFSVSRLEIAEEIERDVGMSANEIFSLSGQSGYRRHERRALEKVLAQHNKAVIVTGGGLVAEPTTYDLLLSSCFTVWLKASPAEHMSRVVAQGDRRPMADNDEAMQDLRQILAGREALYRKADAVVDTTNRSVDACAVELANLCRPVLSSDHAGKAAGIEI